LVTLTADYNQGTGNNLEFVGLAGSSGPFAFPTGGKVELGVLDITVGTGTTTYLVTSLDQDTINGSSSLLGQSDGNTITDTDADLDAGGAGYTGADAASAYSFTVAPPAVVGVPLPASRWVGLAGLGGLLLAMRWTRRVRSLV
jgi:hypothetical protein